MKSILVLLTLALASCSHNKRIDNRYTPSATPAQQPLISRVHSIQHYPVSREELISTLQLENLPSDRYPSLSHQNKIEHIELWRTPSGLIIKASDYAPYTPSYPTPPNKDTPITREDIDKFLNYPHNDAPRKKFDKIIIINQSFEALYTSHEPNITNHQ